MYTIAHLALMMHHSIGPGGTPCTGTHSRLHRFRQRARTIARHDGTWCNFCMNWHQVIDKRSYDMHQIIASILRRDPSQLELVITWIEKWLADPKYSIHAKDALSEWLSLINEQGVAGVLDILDDPGENAARMRHNSPFAILMPQDERTRILHRYETLRPGTRSPGV